MSFAEEEYATPPASPSPAAPPDVLTALPTELALQVLRTALLPMDLLAVSALSRAHRLLAADASAWKLACARLSREKDDASRLFRAWRSMANTLFFPPRPRRGQLFPLSMLSPFADWAAQPELLDSVDAREAEKCARALAFLRSLPYPDLPPKDALLHLSASSSHLVARSAPPAPNAWHLSLGAHLRERTSRRFPLRAEIEATEFEFRFRARSFAFPPPDDGAAEDEEAAERDGEDRAYRAFFERNGTYRSENFFADGEGEVSHYIPHGVERVQHGRAAGMWVVRNEAVIFRSVGPRADAGLPWLEEP
ncbi:hypothetical protein DFJ74DRAFT_247601 [Hyaloraphidium curvatum]|nr:hypothetical protein DFJ74DRAFT_247601 [Hyaloraphidium curvatum]